MKLSKEVNELGKNYANRRKESERPKDDFYPTPSCMVKELIDCEIPLSGKLFPKNLNDVICDPCCGKFAIGNVLREHGYDEDCIIIENDLIYDVDFIGDDSHPFGDYDSVHFRPDKIIMNPPFKHWDKFVVNAKYLADMVYCIGKIDYFNAHGRNVNGLWEHLEWVLPFDRKISFEVPEDENGKVECGMMNTAWFIWNKRYDGYPKIKVLDMQKYIKRKD